MAETPAPKAVTKGINSLFSKKVAGIPVVWLVLLVAVVALYAAIKIKPNTGDDPEMTGDEAPEFDGDIDTSQPVFSATPTIIQPSGVVTGGSVSAVSQPDTDELWKRRAVSWLAGNGYTLDIATSAITKYLAEEPLTALEARAKDAAVVQFGLPPETIPAGGSIPSPPPAPTPSKPASSQGVPPLWHTVMGTSDDSFSELAKLYYGIAGNGTGYINLIAGRNTSLPRTGIAKGTRVRVPSATEPRYYTVTAAKRSLVAIASANSLSAAKLKALNPSVVWPAKVGSRVRVK